MALTRFAAVLSLACAVLLPTPARAQAGSDPVVSLATFDSAWAKVRTHHYDTAFAGHDWSAVRAELRPRVEREPTVAVARAAIREMIARLGVSHYALIPREVNQSLDPVQRERGEDGVPADAGVELRVVGDDVVVWRVQPDAPPAAAGLRPGTAVLRVGDYDPVAALRDVNSLADGRDRQLAHTRFLYAVNALLQGQVGDTTTLTLRLDRDSAAVRLPLRATPGRRVKFGNVPASIVRATHVREDVDGSCVGVIRWNMWMAPIAADIDRAVDAVRDCRGIILDLRGNPGGVAGMVMGIGGHFVDSVRALGTMKMRRNELNFVVNPRRVDTNGRGVPVYDGRLAILVDAMSASTSEIFAAGMQAIGRARVFGEVTAGQALPALASPLPNGDVLMHAIADYLVVDGTRVEGVGVIPDELVPLTTDALRRGEDPPLAAARRWILAPAS